MKKFYIITLIALVIVLAFVLFFIKDNEKEESWVDAYIEIEDNLNSVLECSYNGEKVYYFSHGCCDFIDETYSIDGELICTDGGITGESNCEYEKTDCKVIWDDGEVY